MLREHVNLNRSAGADFCFHPFTFSLSPLRFLPVCTLATNIVPVALAMSRMRLRERCVSSAVGCLMSADDQSVYLLDDGTDLLGRSLAQLELRGLSVSSEGDTDRPRPARTPVRGQHVGPCQSAEKISRRHTLLDAS